MWKLQSSLFAASQALYYLAIAVAVAAAVIIILKIYKDHNNQPTRLEWSTAILVALMAACLFVAKILLVSASNRALKSDVITLYKDLDKFLKTREATQQQQEKEPPRRWAARIDAEDRETKKLYHDQFDTRVRYAREQFALREIHDTDLDHYIAEDPSSPFSFDLLNARLEVLSRQL
jgi:hypothetical protein